MAHLDQDVQLSSSSLVQRRHRLTDQRAEVVTQLEDLVQTVKHLRTEVNKRSSLETTDWFFSSWWSCNIIRPVWLIPASGGWRTGRAGYWGSGRGPDGCSQSLWWSWSAGAAERTETRARPPETHSRRAAQLKQSVCFCVSAECWLHFHFKDKIFHILRTGVLF